MRDLVFVMMVAFAIAAIANAMRSPAPEAPESRLTDVQRHEADPIVASFERDFDRQPGPATPAAGQAIEDDVLYQSVNEALWTRNNEDDLDSKDE